MQKRFRKMLQRIERIASEINVLKSELEDILKRIEEEEGKRKMRGAQKVKVSEKELKQLYEDLRLNFEKRGEEAVHEFVGKNTKSFLKEFFKTNNLPISIKLSKKEIAQELAQQLRVGSIISKREFSPPR